MIELLMVRDPDGPVTAAIYVEGVLVRHREYVVDAGAGWTAKEWKRMGRRYLAKASSETLRAAIAEALESPPGARYID